MAINGDVDDENPDDLDGVDWAERYLGPSIADTLDKYYEKIDDDGRYSKDWEFISFCFRKSKNFVCESCDVNLLKNQRLLHVHHLDKNPKNNELNNLMALCVLCHAEQHIHLNEEITERDRSQILDLRKIQARERAERLEIRKIQERKSSERKLLEEIFGDFEGKRRRDELEKSVNKMEALIESGVKSHLKELDSHYTLKNGGLVISERHKKFLNEIGCDLKDGMAPVDVVLMLTKAGEKKSRFDPTKKSYTAGEDLAVILAMLPRVFLMSEAKALQKRFIDLL